MALLSAGAVPAVIAQAPSAADGPWSGQAQCVLSTRATNYQDDQTHTWRITGGPPQVTGATRHWPAVWSVQGSGSRILSSSNPGSAALAAATGGPSESWTTNVPETSAPIAIWEIPGFRGNNRLRIGSQHAQKTAGGAMRVNASSGQNFAATVWEWQFPAIEDSATATSLSGTITQNLVVGPGWQRPYGAQTTATCTWSFTRGVAGIMSSGRGAGSLPGRAGSGATAGTTGTSGTIAAVPTLANPGANPSLTGRGSTVNPAPVPGGGTGGSSIAGPPASSRVLAGATADLSTTVVPSGMATSWTALEEARYVVSVANHGPADADGAVLAVPDAPNPLSLARLAKTRVICSAATGGAQCPATLDPAQIEQGAVIPRLPSGGTVTVTLFGRVPQQAPNGVGVTSTVSPPGSVPDPDSANNSSSQTQPVAARTGAGTANIETYIEPEPRSTTWWEPNGTARYRARVVSAGPDVATGVVLTVPASQNLSKTGVTCSSIRGGVCPTTVGVGQLEAGLIIPSIPVGGEVVLTFTAAVTGPLGGTVTVMAVADQPTGPRTEYMYQAYRSSTRTDSILLPSTSGTTSRNQTVRPPLPTPGQTTSFCSLPGPVLGPTRATPGSMSITWPHINGASYTVSRNDIGVVTPAAITPNVFPFTVNYVHSAPLYHTQTYVYAVTAQTAQGCGVSQITVTPPRPFSPPAAAFVNNGAWGGNVSVRWSIPEGNDTSMTGFLLFGPGFPAEGWEERTCTVYNAYNECVSPYAYERRVGLGPGDYTWIIAPYWDTQNGRMVDVSSGTRVTLRIP